MIIMDIEKEYVIDMYDRIAVDFNESRYSVWNFVRTFLIGKEHLYGLDVGCGNGKNMIHTNMLGVDNCVKFVDICKNKKKNVILSDCTNLPIKDLVFDYVISISVFHHLSTTKRRMNAIREMTRVVKIGGEILLNVWSVENQDKRRFVSGDNYVPWISRPKKDINPTVYYRYYHIYDEKSIYFLKNQILKEFPYMYILNIYNEKGNWVIHMKKNYFKELS